MQLKEIHIFKARRTLCFSRDGGDIFTCHIGLGFSPAGSKGLEGDGKTPEGSYFICTRNERSRYTLFLGLSYPGSADARDAFRRGVISKAQLEEILCAHTAGKCPPWDTPLGGEIGIHGGGIPAGSGLADNTAGCIALLDDDIRRLWALAPLGTRVIIHP